jgi:hypothetical protein
MGRGESSPDVRTGGWWRVRYLTVAIEEVDILLGSLILMEESEEVSDKEGEGRKGGSVEGSVWF